MRAVEFYEGDTVLAAEALGVDVSNLVQPELNKYITIDVTYTNGTKASIGGTRFIKEGGSIDAFLLSYSKGTKCGPDHASADLVFDDVEYQKRVSKVRAAHKKLEAFLAADLAETYFVSNAVDKNQKPYVRDIVFRIAKDMAWPHL